jgi:nicotinamidase-related amidase
MKKLLIVVDMQNDFVTGTLGSPQAERVLPSVRAKIEEYRQSGHDVIFTRDTHGDDYLTTQEGRFLPVPHCIAGTEGHMLVGGLMANKIEIFDKPTFGSLELAEKAAAGGYGEIELCGLCTDICVVSNALILKARLPETKISVDPACCAGTTEETHKAALQTMKSCQVNVIGS